MRRPLVALVLAVLVSLGAWSLLRPSPRGATAPATSLAAEPAERVMAPDLRRDDRDLTERARRLREGAARREALRARIEAALAARATAAAPGSPAVSAAGADAPLARSRPAAAAEDVAPGSLLDRSGDHGYLARVLNQDLMPLVDECLALAREDRPDLAGVLVLDVELLGDEDIGGVVDTMGPGRGNEIVEPALLECVRESLLATTLPPPPRGGRDAVSLSLRFDPPGGTP